MNRSKLLRSSMAGVCALALVAPTASAQFGTNPQTGQRGIFQCAAEGNRQEIGGVAGAVIGGVIGNRVAEENRAIGTAIGAAVGALAGAWIGCRLQEGDRTRAETAVNTALATRQNQTWSNPTTGASGTVVFGERVTPAAATQVSVSQLVFAPGVNRVANLSTAAAGTASARSAVNLRAGPTTRAGVVGQLRAGEVIDVAGSASGWLLVVRDGQAVGYVRQDLVRRGGTQAASRTECRRLTETVTVGGGQPASTQYVACETAPGGAFELRQA